MNSSKINTYIEMKRNNFLLFWKNLISENVYYGTYLNQFFLNITQLIVG